MTEEHAIARLQDGDISGLETLVKHHQLEAVRAAVLITRDRGIAEEIVQQAFVRAYERIDQFNSQRPFRPWFLRSVINDAIKHAQRRERLVPLDPLE
jgi:RNA polymerase sigma-70 factor, ECF subfamily